ATPPALEGRGVCPPGQGGLPWRAAKKKGKKVRQAGTSSVPPPKTPAERCLAFCASDWNLRHRRRPHCHTDEKGPPQRRPGGTRFKDIRGTNRRVPTVKKHNRKYNPGPAPKVLIDGGDGYYYPDADAERLMDVCARLDRVAGALERIADAL